MLRDYPVDHFLWGLGVGTVALTLALGVAALAGRGRRRAGRVPVTGLLTVVAALVAISPSRELTPGVLVGLAGVTTTATLATRRRPDCRPLAFVGPLLLSAPFAWLLAIDASSIGWVRAVVVGGATVGSVASARTDAEWGWTGLTPAVYAGSAAGVFAAVPNTREAAALLGASVSGALAGWPLGRAHLGRAGAAGATALLVWVAAVGSLGREAAVVGAVTCLGLLVTLPAGRWRGYHRGRTRWRALSRLPAGLPPVLLVQAILVAVASRVAGTSADLAFAVPVATAVAVMAIIAATILHASLAAPATAPRTSAERAPG